MSGRSFTEDDVRMGFARVVDVDGEPRIIGLAFCERARDAAVVLMQYGWTFEDDSGEPRWRRDGVWVTARGRRIDIKAVITPTEARAFAVLAEFGGGE